MAEKTKITASSEMSRFSVAVIKSPQAFVIAASLIRRRGYCATPDWRRSEGRGSLNDPRPVALSSAIAAGDFPLVVPGLVFLQELGEARMHRDIRIGFDA